MESELFLLCNTTTPYQNLGLHYVNSIYQIFQARNLIIHDPYLSFVSEANKSLNGFVFVVSMYASKLLWLSTALCLRTQTRNRLVTPLCSIYSFLPMWSWESYATCLCLNSLIYTMGIIIVLFTVVVRIKWVIIWMYLEFGVYFYYMTISFLEYWTVY